MQASTEALFNTALLFVLTKSTTLLKGSDATVHSRDNHAGKHSLQEA